MTNRTIFSFLAAMILALDVSAACAGQQDPLYYRRTLFVPVGERMLVLEAPVEMCFFDRTEYAQHILHDQLKEQMDQKHKESALAFFMPCLDLAAIEGGQTPSEPLPVLGSVSWLNPMIGEETKMPRAEYLDMRETSFRDYGLGKINDFHADALKADKKTGDETGMTASLFDPEKYKFDDSVHRTENGISLGYTSDVDFNYQKYHVDGILATTVIRRIPVEFSLRYAGQETHDTAALRALMDKFVAQQITLNE